MIQKNLKYLGLGAFVLFQIFSVSIAYAQGDTGTNWDIKDFNSTIQINKDSTILVTEHIVVDFSQEQHHGIVRIIPVQYTDTDGNTSEIPINVVSIKDDKGTGWNYSTSDDGQNLSIQIGDPNILLNNIETYNITYQAQRALTNYQDHDELYWNVSGNGWDVPVEKAEATVKLPQSVDKSNLKATCYTGTSGSTAQDCSATVADGSTFQFATTTGGTAANPAFQAGEGLTIVAGYPKGIIQPSPPSPEQIFAAAPWYMKIYLFLTDNWGLLIPVVVALIMFYLWFTKGRDPSTGKTAIMPLYEAPDNLRPTEVGTIVDESVDIRDITSAIIDLAVRGYLKIIENKDKSFLGVVNTTYKFQLLKPNYSSDPKLLDFEKKILDAVFGGATTVNLSDLNNKFYKYIPDIKKTVYNRLIANGYFPSDPEKIRGAYMGTGFALIFIPLFLLGLLMQYATWSLILGAILSGVVIMAGGYFMPKRTLKGVETRYKILGLEEFIKTAETDRLKFQEKENIFEKLLPYAMTLGIADKWTKAFEGIYKSPPSWYTSNDPYFLTNFSTLYLLNSMNSFSHSMGTTFQSSPRSSGSGFGGGGFSGGGGGGGGGHAW